MGNDVFKRLEISIPLLNIQKARVDYLLGVSSNNHLRARTGRIAPFMKRRDIIQLIAQEEALDGLLSRSPKILYMDSFAELTDQLFVHRDSGWQFCCNYSDLDHSPEFEREFEVRGLLPICDLMPHYQRFFEFVRQKFGRIPIIFLHFPVVLEKREKFRDRYYHILDAISKLSEQYPPFFSLTVHDSIVDWPEEGNPDLTDFPYHYNRRTYEAFAEQLRATRVFQLISNCERNYVPS